jgi:hypothetical protein
MWLWQPTQLAEPVDRMLYSSVLHGETELLYLIVLTQFGGGLPCTFLIIALALTHELCA